MLKVVAGSPQDYGHRRPTWTQELLVRVLADRTGIVISVSTMCRLLRRLRIRRGMPKPTVGCPWSPRARNRRIRLIRRLIETLPPYCPDDNKIERNLWRNLHANVTRNHKCRTMDELMTQVRYYLAAVNRAAAIARRREAA